MLAIAEVVSGYVFVLETHLWPLLQMMIMTHQMKLQSYSVVHPELWGLPTTVNSFHSASHCSLVAVYRKVTSDVACMIVHAIKVKKPLAFYNLVTIVL